MAAGDNLGMYKGREGSQFPADENIYDRLYIVV